MVEIPTAIASWPSQDEQDTNKTMLSTMSKLLFGFTYGIISQHVLCESFIPSRKLTLETGRINNRLVDYSYLNFDFWFKNKSLKLSLSQ